MCTNPELAFWMRTLGGKGNEINGLGGVKLPEIEVTLEHLKER